MLIQPSVQSAVQTATFAPSVSATGVEDTVVRAPIPPVEPSSRDAAADNSLKKYPPAGTARPPGETSLTGQNPARQPDSTDASVKDPAGADSATTQDDAETSLADAAREDRQQQAEQVVLAQLKARDQEVRVHEAAHAAVGGRYAGAPSLEYKRGPDGKNYAVGGEVSISTSGVSGDPRATIDKARVIRAAALAPAQPSPQDRRVASEAVQLELDAQNQLQQQAVEARSAAEKAREQQSTDESSAQATTGKTADKADDEDKKVTPELAPEAKQTTEKPVLSARLTREGAASDQKDSAAAEDDSSARPATPRLDARQQLEKILLGSGGLLRQANSLGLVDPQNPYGKSGYLDVLA